MTVNPLEPALWCDHGQWQVVKDEACLHLPWGPRWIGDSRVWKVRRWQSYRRCRVWCVLHGYGWLPVLT